MISGKPTGGTVIRYVLVEIDDPEDDKKTIDVLNLVREGLYQTTPWGYAELRTADVTEDLAFNTSAIAEHLRKKLG
jgi:hypothetical protein